MATVKKKTANTARQTSRKPIATNVAQNEQSSLRAPCRVTRSKTVVAARDAEKTTLKTATKIIPVVQQATSPRASTRNVAKTTTATPPSEKQKKLTDKTTLKPTAAVARDKTDNQPTFRVPNAAPARRTASRRTRNNARCAHDVIPRDSSRNDVTPLPDSSAKTLTSTPLKRDERALRIPLSPIQNVSQRAINRGYSSGSMPDRQFLSQLPDRGSDSRWEATGSSSRRELVLPEQDQRGNGVGSTGNAEKTLAGGDGQVAVGSGRESMPDVATTSFLSSPITYSRGCSAWSRSEDDEAYADESSSEEGAGSGDGCGSSGSPALFDLRDMIAGEQERKFNRARARVLEEVGTVGDGADGDWGAGDSDESDGCGADDDDAPPKKKRAAAKTSSSSAATTGKAVTTRKGKPEKARVEAGDYKRWVKKMVAEFEEIDNTSLCVSE